jgi:hypothetical protein
MHRTKSVRQCPQSGGTPVDCGAANPLARTNMDAPSSAVTLPISLAFRAHYGHNFLGLESDLTLPGASIDVNNKATNC